VLDEATGEPRFRGLPVSVTDASGVIAPTLLPNWHQRREVEHQRARQRCRFIDRYADEHRIGGRSGVIQRALSLLRTHELADEYREAWGEWDPADTELWEAAIADGIEDTDVDATR
jgi:hypothetical protein